ncbi:hypothetical protein [Dysgonomonas sp. 511]|uniref:hypothetical protein n=1 Tax=Dysgonomonas sp. 511 TaxID=2302930 RepID=UPI0013D5F35B|nr:hypothetical protein [Dysgonomonas sp. 511]NDV78429.1 hypothetical protein [Dysgonomonas sp. 511]
MANKELKFEVKSVGFEPLYKNLNKVNDRSKELVDNYKKINDAFKSVLNPAAKSIESVDKLLKASVKHILPNMEKIAQLNEKMAKSDLETNALKNKNLSVEIAGLEQKKTVMSQLYEYYDNEEKKILEKGKKRQKEQLKGIDNYIIAQKAAGKDTTEAEKDRAEFIKNSDNAILNAVKANNEKRKEAITASVKETSKSITEMYTKQKALILEAAELERQKARNTYDTAIEQAKTDEERIALESSKSERIKAIDEDMNNQLAANSKTQLDATTKFVDDAIKQVTDRVAENKKNGNGITDIVMTKENIAASKEQLEEYKKMLEDSRNAAILHYAALEAANKDDASKLKQIQAEKAKTMATYTDGISKIDKAMTETSQKENGLRTQQIKDFVNVAEKSLKEHKKSLDKLKEYKEKFNEGADWLADKFIPKVEDIEGEIKKLDEKQAEVAKNRESYSDELKMLRYKQADNSQQMTDYEIEQLKKLEDAEQENLKKEQEIEKEKEKKKKEKEKAERDRKKVELGKKIVEATADVAASVAKALTAGPFIGQAIAAIYAAYGTVQIGIMTKQLSKLEDGGLLRGKRHSQGGMRIEGTNIEVEGGEYVINRESTSKNLGLVRYINSQRKALTRSDLSGFFSSVPYNYEMPFSREFAAGRELPAIEAPDTADNKGLLDAIKSIRIEPKVAVTDILRVQDEMVQVDRWSGI